MFDPMVFLNDQQLHLLPEKIKEVATSLFNYRQLPNENALESSIRRIVEAIGSCFILLGMLLSFSTTLIGIKIFNFFQPGTRYKVGSKERNSSLEMIKQDLLSIGSNRFQFDTIEIAQGFHCQSLQLSIDVIELLKGLNPKLLILKNIEPLFPFELKILETAEHYYTNFSVEGRIPYHQLNREEKIEVTLPEEGREMVETLQRLIDEQKRVTRLYFTANIPENHEERLGQLLTALAPERQFLVVNYMPSSEI